MPKTEENFNIAVFKDGVDKVEYIQGVPVVEDIVVEDMEVNVPPGDVRVFEVDAKNWEFVPNRIEVSFGDRVQINVKAVDVAHGFSIRELGINKQMEAYETGQVKFVADKRGVFEFGCSVYCGRGHGDMKGTLIVR